MEIGVIDIGSDSIKMIVVNTDKGLIIEKELKEYITLGEKSNNFLTENKMNEAIRALTKFKHECEGTDKVIVVATEAVRSAENKQEFINKVKQIVGLNVKVLKGEEEAYYDYFATINSMEVEDNDLIIDAGGGSTELILVKDGNIKHSISLPFGVVTLADKFKLHDKESKQQENEIKEFVNNQFNKLDWLKETKGHNLIGIGGSITNIGSIHLKENKESIELLHTHSIQSQEFNKIYNQLKNETDAERLEEKGLEKEEVNFVVAAGAVVNILIDMLEIKNIIFSKNGVREGLVYKEIKG